MFTDSRRENLPAMPELAMTMSSDETPAALMVSTACAASVLDSLEILTRMRRLPAAGLKSFNDVEVRDASSLTLPITV